MEEQPFKKYILLVIIPFLMLSYYQISRKFKLNDQTLQDDILWAISYGP